MNNKVELGDVARDIISGFEGVVMKYVFYLYECERCCIAPQNLTKDGQIQEGKYFNASQLEVIKKSVIPAKEEILKEVRIGGLCKNNKYRINLGDLVKDNITGFKGIAMQKIFNLDGCAQMLVMPQSINKDSTIPSGYFFDEPQLKILKRNIVSVKSETINATRTGGFVSQTPTR